MGSQVNRPNAVHGRLCFAQSIGFPHVRSMITLCDLPGEKVPRSLQMTTSPRMAQNFTAM